MQHITNLWRSGRAGKIAVGCGGLIALLIVCSIFASLGGEGSSTPTVTVQAFVEAEATRGPELRPTNTAKSTQPPLRSAPGPTDTPSPTDTSEPTSTPGPAARPTDTPLLPKPTNTPLPTNTPESTNTSEPTNTPRPTETPPPPTPSPTMTPSHEPTTIPDDFASGGLGLSRKAWEQVHVQSSTGPSGFVNYDGGKYSVIFMNGNVWHLEWYFGAYQPTLDEARIMATAFISEDSQFVEIYSPAGFPELIVDLYLSESLKGRFESDVWIGGEPGNFIVIYDVYDGRVPQIVIGTGNNP